MVRCISGHTVSGVDRKDVTRGGLVHRSGTDAVVTPSLCCHCIWQPRPCSVLLMVRVLARAYLRVSLSHWRMCFSTRLLFFNNCSEQTICFGKVFPILFWVRNTRSGESISPGRFDKPSCFGNVLPLCLFGRTCSVKVLHQNICLSFNLIKRMYSFGFLVLISREGVISSYQLLLALARVPSKKGFPPART